MYLLSAYQLQTSVNAFLQLFVHHQVPGTMHGCKDVSIAGTRPGDNSAAAMNSTPVRGVAFCTSRDVTCVTRYRLVLACRVHTLISGRAGAGFTATGDHTLSVGASGLLSSVSSRQ